MSFSPTILYYGMGKTKKKSRADCSWGKLYLFFPKLSDRRTLDFQVRGQASRHHRPRFSGANNWELFRQHMEGDRRTWEFFDALRGHAAAMAGAFRSEDMREVAAVMTRDWETRRRMLPAMSTPAIDGLIRQCRRRGAWAARLCGAGGGGCLALIIDPEARPRLQAVAARHGARVLPCQVHRRGLTLRVVGR